MLSDVVEDTVLEQGGEVSRRKCSAFVHTHVHMHITSIYIIWKNSGVALVYSISPNTPLNITSPFTVSI